MTTGQPVSDAQQLRVEVGCLLDRFYPEFIGLSDQIPDDLLAAFQKYMTAAPSAVLLMYLDGAFGRSQERGAVTLRNVLKVLDEACPEGTDNNALVSQQERSARVSFTVTVVQEMADKCLGRMNDFLWDQGTETWVRAAVRLGLAVPGMWREASTRDRLLIYLALVGRGIRMNGLISLCRERGFIDGELVKTYLENDAAALKVGVL